MLEGLLTKQCFPSKQNGEDTQFMTFARKKCVRMLFYEFMVKLQLRVATISISNMIVK